MAAKIVVPLDGSSGDGQSGAIADRSVLERYSPRGVWGTFDVVGQLAATRATTYRNDAHRFADWLTAEKLTLASLTRSDFIRYRKYLQETYAKSTAARMLTIARRLLAEGVKRKTLGENIAVDVRGFKGVGNDETPHTALSKAQVRDLLTAVDRTTAMGKRDYALLLLLLKTGLRRAECAALLIGDFGIEQGHNILTVRHGTGDKRRIAKVQPEAVRDYLDACGRAEAKGAPVFVAFDKGDYPTHAPLSDTSMERIVKKYGRAIGVALTPHGLRATCVTLALENGAKLQQVQYAVGHADPRTTERYQKRKLNLDDNASDFVRW